MAEDGERILIHVSNFRKVKRIDDVLSVFRRVQQQFPVKLLLVGDGPERPRLENLCREWGICSSVKFLGKQDTVEELLSLADLFLLPSEQESFGLVALEAMACEVPVIASDAGGLREVILDGQCGYTLPVGDVTGMAEKACWLLSDDRRLADFRRAALDRAHAFSLDRILPQYESLYQSLV
jgi:N-acetyl-alpha-D-glucosaminyl L-malate synthase BshA